MKNTLFICLMAMLAACSFVQAPDKPTPIQIVEQKIIAPIEKKASDDFAVSAGIGTIVNRPELVQCNTYLKGVVDSLQSTDSVLAKLREVDTRGLPIASSLKDYFEVELERQSGMQALQDFRSTYPKQCGQLSAVIAGRIIERAVFGAALSRMR